MTRLIFGLIALVMSSAVASAQTYSEANGFEPSEVKATFDEYGCFHDDANNTHFDFAVPKAGYVLYVLADPTDSGSATKDDPMGGRVPLMKKMGAKKAYSNPVKLAAHARDSVIAAVTPGNYQATFGDNTYWGSRVRVSICYSTNKNTFTQK